MTGKLLVSACLVGRPVRYDGQAKPLAHPLLARLAGEGRLVPLCPEMAAGLPVPRLPAEIEAGMTGADVLDGRARVLDSAGGDVTAAFLDGARRALDTATAHGCRHALLIDGSPSCGPLAIYDGSFSGRRHAGQGVVAALLARAGIAVHAPAEIAALEAALG